MGKNTRAASGPIAAAPSEGFGFEDVGCLLRFCEESFAQLQKRTLARGSGTGP